MTRKEFPNWYADVDRIMQSRCGLGIDDLPDGPSYDCWDDGMTPDEYVRLMLQQEGFDD